MDTSADVVIVGAGPSGLSCAVEAKGAGLSVIVLEKGSLVDYIRRFPANLVWFSTPELLEIGGVPFVISTVRPTRVDTLNYYQKVAGYHDLDVRCFDAVQTIRRSPAGFEVVYDETPGAPLAGIVSALAHFGEPIFVLAGESEIEAKAHCVLALGQTMEQAGDYPSAIRFYREAFAMEPASNDVWYFINNNLGFSLNTLGQFAQGEMYCRKAIEVDASRPNAHKNLGIALTGQGEHREAARSFVAATQANAADSRAFRLLQDLLRQHPELEFEFEALAESCQKAVEVVAKKADEMKPVVLRGWRKHLFLLRMRLSSIRKRIQGGWR